MNQSLRGIVGASLRQYFSKSRMEVVCIRDNTYGFEGQVLSVRPGFYNQVLQPKGFAIVNAPGFRARLLPDLDKDVLSDKLQRKSKINVVMMRIASLHLEFVKVPLFSNPNIIKEPISEQEVIDELKTRFKFIINKQELNLNRRINSFGQTTVSIENYFSEELGKPVSFPIRIVVKRPGKVTTKTEVAQSTSTTPKVVNLL